MKRILFVLVVAVAPLTASFAVCSDLCGRVDENFIKKHTPLGDFKIESKKAVNGLCEVTLVTQAKVMTLYAGKDHVIHGSMYQGKKNMSDETVAALRKELFKRNLSLLGQVVYFTYRPKAGTKRTMYLFTDPLCAYCHRAEGRIAALADKYGVEVNVVLVAINGDRARNKCVEAKCRNIGLGEYMSVAWKKAEPAAKDLCRQGKVINKLADSALDALLIDGVPAFYLGDGSFVSGADMEALAEALEKSQPAGPREPRPAHVPTR
jgi:thiol:disulfide interchange protein DsbC